MQERTEKPTKRKLQRAKKRGESPFSQELLSAIILLGGVLLLWVLTPLFKIGFENSFNNAFSLLKNRELKGILGKVIFPLLIPTLYFLIGLFFLAFLSLLSQKGWVWSLPKKKAKGQFRPLFTLFKLILIGVISYFSLKKSASLHSLFFLPTTIKVFSLFKHIFSLLLHIILGLLCLGIGDWFYQKWKFYKQQHMTRQELKEEQREENVNHKRR